MSKIITHHEYPPIPDRRFDWCAYHEEHVELAHRYGWGPTEAEAIADLERLDAEYAESNPDPCTQEAREQGCTCTVPVATTYDIDPPEPRINRDCPLHGWAPDPDHAYEQARDDRLWFGDEHGQT